MDHLSLKGTAYNLIKDKLLNGEFEPNERLMESELAGEISMSRTPVREAINTLAAEGFVTIVPRKGVFCAPITPGELTDLLEIRSVLEDLAVRKYVRNPSADTNERLHRNLERFENALDRGDYRECNLLDNEFHHILAESSGNRRLFKVLNGIEDFIRIARVYEKKEDAGEKNLLTLKDHREIYRQIALGNEEKAVEALARNIGRMRVNLNL